MNEIEERAKKTYSKEIDIEKRKSYIEGAITQKQIDIDNACRWWTYNCKSVINYYDIEEFRKTMERKEY